MILSKKKIFIVLILLILSVSSVVGYINLINYKKDEIEVYRAKIFIPEGEKITEEMIEKSFMTRDTFLNPLSKEEILNSYSSGKILSEQIFIRGMVSETSSSNFYTENLPEDKILIGIPVNLYTTAGNIIKPSSIVTIIGIVEEDGRTIGSLRIVERAKVVEVKTSNGIKIDSLEKNKSFDPIVPGVVTVEVDKNLDTKLSCYEKFNLIVVSPIESIPGSDEKDENLFIINTEINKIKIEKKEEVKIEDSTSNRD